MGWDDWRYIPHVSVLFQESFELSVKTARLSSSSWKSKKKTGIVRHASRDNNKKRKSLLVTACRCYDVDFCIVRGDTNKASGTLRCGIVVSLSGTTRHGGRGGCTEVGVWVWAGRLARSIKPGPIAGASERVERLLPLARRVDSGPSIGLRRLHSATVGTHSGAPLSSTLSHTHRLPRDKDGPARGSGWLGERGT